MFNNLKEDYRMHKYIAGFENVTHSLVSILFLGLCNDGFRAVMLYRTGRYFRLRKHRIIATIFERIMHHVCHCWISTYADIESGFAVTHVCGLVIGGGTKIGKNCQVRQNVTLGGNFNKKDAYGRQYPTVGDNVSFGAGAVIIGPIKVGSNSIIGANSVVTRDVPEGVIVFGVPAVVIKKRWDENTGRRL